MKPARTGAGEVRPLCFARPQAGDGVTRGTSDTGELGALVAALDHHAQNEPDVGCVVFVLDHSGLESRRLLDQQDVVVATELDTHGFTPGFEGFNQRPRVSDGSRTDRPRELAKLSGPA